MAVEALHAAAAATENWTKTVVSASGVYGGLGGGGPPCRAYGPLERDVVVLHEATFGCRKQVLAEANGMAKFFDARMERFNKGMGSASKSLSQAHEGFKDAKSKAGSVDKVHDAVRVTCKTVQEMLECEGRCEEARSKTSAERYVTCRCDTCSSLLLPL